MSGEAKAEIREPQPEIPKPRAGSPKPAAESREPLAALAVALAMTLAACAAQNRIDDATRAFHGNQPAKAAQLFRGAIDAGDRSVYTLYNYGTSLLAADSLRLAAEVLERAAESQIEEVRYRALFNLGIAAGRSGDLPAAATALKRFVAEAPPRSYEAELREARRLLASVRDGRR